MPIHRLLMSDGPVARCVRAVSRQEGTSTRSISDDARHDHVRANQEALGRRLTRVGQLTWRTARHGSLRRRRDAAKDAHLTYGGRTAYRLLLQISANASFPSTSGDVNVAGLRNALIPTDPSSPSSILFKCC